MRKISPEVAKHMDNLSNEAGVISALAIDQRGSLKRMLAEAANKPADETTIVDFKKAVSKELTPYASAILTDPEYGLPATKVRDKNCGLLLSYEKTGYDTTEPGRMCDLIADQSALRIKNDGADAVKFLLYYDPDESDEINDKKKAFVERVGAETKANGLPFFLELLTYDGKMDDVKSEEYAKVKPEKVFKTIEEFSKPQYDVTVLKVEIPFNIKYVEGFNGDNNVVYTQEEAKKLLKKQWCSLWTCNLEASN
jgi:tagatose 1,6-diphosphate aldolase